MINKIRYIWEDEDGNEKISKYPPINAYRGMMGGTYTPNYRKVVLMEVEDD